MYKYQTSTLRIKIESCKLNKSGLAQLVSARKKITCLVKDVNSKFSIAQGARGHGFESHIPTLKTDTATINGIDF